MIVSNVVQMSEEWFVEKAGVPSASHFGEILSATGKISKQSKNYMYRLAAERILGRSIETYQSADMKRGIELEPKARSLYQLRKLVEVKEVGMVYPDEQKKYSCSPDGDIPQKEKGLEIKCPKEHTHIDYLLNNKLPAIYFPQVQGSMAVTGYKTWDFMSYCPGLDPLIITIERDEKYISALKEQLDEFCFKLAKITKQLKEMG